VFTQCPKCQTIFRLSAGVLRAAGGQVRCGRCGEVFNALTRLAEQPTEFPRGLSPRDLEARADAILEAGEPLAAAQIAQLELEEETHPDFDDDEDFMADAASLEFTLPPGELDRVFIETARGPLELLSAAAPAAPIDTPIETPIDTSIEAPIDAPFDTPIEEAGIAGLNVPDEVHREMLASYAHAELPQINPPRRGLPLAAWAGGAVILAALLVLQVIRTNGEWLAAHIPLFGGGTGPLGALSSYQLRQWGVTGDPEGNGTLRVRASLMNVAAQVEPYPLLRVTLADRFGARVGRREFTAAEYLGKNPAAALAPGEKVDAVLDILDPGKDAEGFEIDVCVAGAGKKLSCADDTVPQTK
jgi:predicted Zn finger-like uncharacterized protein